jgi:hypothetical protein
MDRLSQEDKEWLKKNCGKVDRSGTAFMIFAMWFIFLIQGCNF